MSSENRYSRQGFLGDNAPSIISSCRVGIIGLGGGGSHLVQQLAHIGFQHFVNYDPDIVEESNLNRLVGATTEDVKNKSPKIDVAKRVILGLNPSAIITSVQSRWQEKPEPLRSCDIIFGCVDGFGERRDLEIFNRRHMIPLIDIGLDVHKADGEPPRMTGQAILSMPGQLCFQCMGFITDALLAKEAEKYGAAGIRPQVIWPNGILASTAVGVAIDLLTGWTGRQNAHFYMTYDANLGVVQPSVRLEYLPKGPCPHFPASAVGRPKLIKL